MRPDDWRRSASAQRASSMISSETHAGCLDSTLWHRGSLLMWLNEHQCVTLPAGAAGRHSSWQLSMTCAARNRKVPACWLWRNYVKKKGDTLKPRHAFTQKSPLPTGAPGESRRSGQNRTMSCLGGAPSLTQRRLICIVYSRLKMEPLPSCRRPWATISALFSLTSVGARPIEHHSTATGYADLHAP